MNFEDVFKEVQGIPGWMGKDDCSVLYDYVKNVEGLIVEIGCFMGISTKVMALASPKSRIIAIDSFQTVHSSSGIINSEVARKGFIKNIEGLNIMFIHKSSHLVAETWNEKIDLLHIDGDHRYRGVKKDIVHFVPWVKSGGYVLFHDYVVGKREEETDLYFYENEEYGIHKAINESMDMFENVEIVSGFAVCKKK